MFSTNRTADNCKKELDFFKEKLKLRGYPDDEIDQQMASTLSVCNGPARLGGPCRPPHNDRSLRLKRKFLITTFSSTTNSPYLQHAIRSAGPLLRPLGLEVGLSYRSQANLFRKFYKLNWPPS